MDNAVNSNTDEIDFIDCACYTKGRRHPEVLGSLGVTQLPFQITSQALAVFATVGVLLVLTWVKGGWWTWLMPTPVNAALCVVLPVVAGAAAQMLRIDGRSPVSGGLAFIRYGIRNRRGVVAGRPMPRRRTYRMSTRGLVAGAGDRR